MNSIIAANINGGISNREMANGSYSSVLLSSVEFALTEVKSNFSAASSQGKYCIKLIGKEELRNDLKIYHQNKNSIENSNTFVKQKLEQCAGDSIPAPKVQLYTGKINVEWNQMHKIGAGLVNFGNTCFMNTVLQCLTYCPPLANYLLHDNDHSSKCTTTGFCMMCVLKKHIKMAFERSGGVLAPSELNKKLRLIAKHFHGERQEDAHEYLRYVIDHLWKTCIPQINGGSKLDPASKETTVINKIFGGYHRSQVICLKCKKESNTYDHFMEFILDIKQNVGTLQKALEKFTQPELLQQDNCYKCPKCKMKVEAQKRFTVYQAPIVATFQLKRFDYNRPFGGKISKIIMYPEKLNLRPYMSDTQGEPLWYSLNAVLVHSGNSCNSGHYYCYVKNSYGNWYMMNDEKVQCVNLDQVLNQCAYVLFYIKKQNTERLPLKKVLDSKIRILKGPVSSSQFSRVCETKGLKTSHLHKEILQSAGLKSNSSPSNVKNIVTPATEKKMNGFQTYDFPTQISSSKRKMHSSETEVISHGGLVPYVKDSPESSDGDEDIVPNSYFKPPLKLKSFENSQSSPTVAIEAKPSKSVIDSSPHYSVHNPVTKVNATGSWIVTDVPQTLSSYSSSSNGVNSTTDWQVIESSDVKSACFPKISEVKKECSNFSEGSMHILSTSEQSKHLCKVTNSSLNLEKSFNYSNNPPSKCNFQKLKCDGNSEKIKTFKRKLNDHSSKTYNSYSYHDHKESQHSPLAKKIKYAENSSFVKQESDFRNFNHVANSSKSVPTQKSYSNCFSSRNSLVNGVSTPANSFKNSSSKNEFSNGYKHKKDDIYSKGRRDNSASGSEREILLASNQGKNSSLYGTEVPTWRKESYYRPSVMSAHERRRSFDDYDKDFDSGKRKCRYKRHYDFNRMKFNHSKNYSRHPNHYRSYGGAR